MSRMRQLLGVVVPVAFFGGVGTYVWSVDPGALPSAADLAIVQANLVREPAAAARPLRARLGGLVELVAVDQETTEVMAGEETKVTLYWRCLRDMDRDLKVFGHLEGPDGSRQNLDHHPVYGLHPLRACAPGSLVRDEVWVAFPPRAARGEHVLWTGVFALAPPYPRLRLQSDGGGAIVQDADGRIRAAAWTVR